MRQSRKQGTADIKGIETQVDHAQSPDYHSQVRALLGMPDRSKGGQFSTQIKPASQFNYLIRAFPGVPYGFGQPYVDEPFDVNQGEGFEETTHDYIESHMGAKEQEKYPSQRKNIREGKQSLVSLPSAEKTERSGSEVKWKEMKVIGSGNEKPSPHQESEEKSAPATPARQKVIHELSDESTQVDDIQIPEIPENPNLLPRLTMEIPENKKAELSIPKVSSRDPNRSPEILVQTTPKNITASLLGVKAVNMEAGKDVLAFKQDSPTHRTISESFRSETTSVTHMQDQPDTNHSKITNQFQTLADYQQTDAQIEQLRDAVRQLSRKVSTQSKESAEKDEVKQPVQPTPQPQPVVIINRVLSPAHTGRAFWERRYLGRVRLKVTR